MCSHETVTWNVTDNFVTDRMIDKSLTHKFISSRKLRKRTKVLNAEIRKYCGVKDYKHYIELKTNVLRNLTDDTDTGDSSSLTDVDYDMIYSSPSKQAKYVAKNSTERYIYTSEEEVVKECQRKIDTKFKEKSRSKNTEKRMQERKLSNYTAVSKKYVNIGWQEVVKKSNGMSYLRKRTYTDSSDNEGNMLDDNDRNYFKAQSSNQSLSVQFDSQNSTASDVMKSGNSNAADNKLSSEDNMISNKTKPLSKRKIQNHKNQRDTINESNAKLNSQASHCQSSPSRLTSLENSNDSDNELNTNIKLKDSNSNKLTEATNESLINTKNYGNTSVSHKSKLLKDARRNLTPMLEEANSMNNDTDIKKDENIEDTLNYDQLLLTTASSNQHSTSLRKTRTNAPKMQNLSPNASSLDQQKDSGFDEDSQERFVKIKRSNKITSRNMKENIERPLSPQFKKIDDQVDENVKICAINQKDKEDEHFAEAENSSDIQKRLLSPEQDCMKDSHRESCDHIRRNENDREVQKPSEEEEITLRLNDEDNDIDKEEISLINHEDKTCFMKRENSCYQKRQSVSPKKNRTKDAYMKSDNDVSEEQDSREKKEPSGEEMKKFVQLNQIDEDAEMSSTNHENKTRFVKSDDSCDIQKQQLLSSKENHIKDVHSKSYNNILNKDNRQKDEEKEEKDLQLNQVDQDTKTYLINQEEKTCMTSEDTCDIQKQLLPKVKCTEILNKKYKLIDKEDNDVKNNIEKIDNIDNNIDIATEHTPIKKNALIHCPDVINHNIDNWQEEMIDAPMASETDNEEDNVSYVSPETKKRLQQQARLNLVVSSDSNESSDEHVTTETSRKHIDSSDMSYYSEDDRLKNDETNCASEQTKTDISRSEDICKDICIRKEATSIPVETAKLGSTNTNEEIRKKVDPLTKCIYEKNNSFQSTTSPLKETQYCENVYNDDDRSEDVKEDVENFQLRLSESNVSCNNEESMNQFPRDKQSRSLDKENMFAKSNQSEDGTSAEVGTRCRSRCEQNAEASTKRSNAHLNISCQYRPSNLHELVEDQELLVETMSASFTLANLSEDEEAFILNVPNKVLQCNLQGQLLTLGEKSIKFNESKYRIVRKEVGTTSCIFATGKKQKPHKIINIKKISTITVREKLPRHPKKPDVSNSYSSVSSVSKPTKINNRQTDETDSKMLKVSNHKNRKRRKNSDSL